MQFVDVSHHPHFSSLLDWSRGLPSASNPQDLLDELVASIPGRGGPLACAEVVAQSGACTLRRLRGHDGMDLLPDGPVRETTPDGFLRQMTRTPMFRIAHDLDLSTDPALPGAMAVYRSAIAMPLVTADSTSEWIFAFDRHPQGVGYRELQDLVLRVSLVTAATTNLQMMRQLFEANLKIQEEITAIAAIQRALLPENLPHPPGLRIAASYQTLGQAGGDFYDLVPLGSGLATPTGGEGPWAILIGDVSGHGPAAAMVMAMLHSILHAYPRCPEHPGEMLAHANRHLCDKRINPIFATAFLALYDPASRQLAYARAGHHPPLLMTPGKPLAALDAVGDMPLGIDADATFESAVCTMSPEQVMVLYTDGILDARSPGGDYFEARGLERALASARPSAHAAIRAINDALLAHADGTPPTDDQTLLALQLE